MLNICLFVVLDYRGVREWIWFLGLGRKLTDRNLNGIIRIRGSFLISCSINCRWVCIFYG